MENMIEAQSLFFLKTLSDAIEKTRGALPFLDETLPPSEILSLSGKFLRVVTSVDNAVSVLSTVGRQLESDYKLDITKYRALRNTYIDRLNERRASGTQMNIGAELYDGEMILKEIQFTIIGRGFTSTISDIVKPEEYSVLKIVDRLEHNDVLDRIQESDKWTFGLMNNYLKNISEMLLTIKRLLSNPQFMGVMSTDSISKETIAYTTGLNSSMRSIFSVLSSLRSNVTDSFQLHLVLANNYEIYKKAVDTITSLALESIFNPNITYTIS